MNDNFNVAFKLTPELDQALLNSYGAKISEAQNQFEKGNARLKEFNSLLSQGVKLTDEETKEYSKLNEQTIKTVAEIRNATKAMEGLKKETSEAHEKMAKMKEGFSEIGKTALGVFTGGAMLGGFQSLTSGFESLIEKGLQVKESQEDLKVSFTLAGLEGKELKAQLLETGIAGDKIAKQFGVSATEVKRTSGELALMAGITGKTNEDITQVVTGIVRMGKGMFSTTEVIRAFTKGGIEGDESLGRLKMQFPGLARALEGCVTPAEKSAAALKYLKTGFDEIQNSDLTQLANAKESFGKFEKAISSILINAILPLVNAIGSILMPVVDWLIEALKNPIFGVIASVFITLAVGAGLIAAGLAIWTSAQILLNSSLVITQIQATLAWLATLGPIAWIIAGIVALGVVIVVLYQKFDWMRALVKDVWEGIKLGAALVWDYIKTYFVTPFHAFIEGIKGAAKVLSDVFHGDFKKAISDVGETVGNVGNSIKKDITNGINDAKEAIDGFKKGVDEAYNSEHLLTDEQKEQLRIQLELNDAIDKSKEALDAVTKGYQDTIGKLETYEQIKRLNDKQYKALRDSADTEEAKKNLDKVRFANDSYKKEQEDKLNTLKGALIKENETKKEFDNKFNINPKDKKEVADTSHSTELEKKTLELQKSLNDNLLKYNDNFIEEGYSKKVAEIERENKKVIDGYKDQIVNIEKLETEKDKKGKNKYSSTEIDEMNKQVDILKMLAANAEQQGKMSVDKYVNGFMAEKVKIADANKEFQSLFQSYSGDKLELELQKNDLQQKYEADIQNEKLTEEEKYRLTCKYLDDIDQVESKYAKKTGDNTARILAESFSSTFSSFNPEQSKGSFDDSKFRDGLKDEEKALNDHSIDYKTYVDKTVLLEHQRAEAIKKIHTDLWKNVGDTVSKAFDNMAKAEEKKAIEDAKSATTSKNVYSDLAAAAAMSAASQIMSGKSAGKAILDSLLTQAQGYLAIKAPDMIAAQVTIDPVGGWVTGLGEVAALEAMLAAARSLVSGLKFHTGKSPDGSGYGQEIPATILSSEAVMPPGVSQKDSSLYNWQIQTGRTFYEYVDETPAAFHKILERHNSKTGHFVDYHGSHKDMQIEHLNNQIMTLNTKIDVLSKASKETARNTGNANDISTFIAKEARGINQNTKDKSSIVHLRGR